jgi:hypothetical protein
MKQLVFSTSKLLAHALGGFVVELAVLLQNADLPPRDPYALYLACELGE